MKCEQIIDLRRPRAGKWEGRGFGRRFVWAYVCPTCGAFHRVRANAFRGKTPEPGIGGIVCGGDLALLKIGEVVMDGDEELRDGHWQSAPAEAINEFVQDGDRPFRRGRR